MQDFKLLSRETRRQQQTKAFVRSLFQDLLLLIVIVFGPVLIGMALYLTWFLVRSGWTIAEFLLQSLL